MSLAKQHIGRRVAGVGVAVTLMVLGLAAPASAVGPSVASFTPTSGPIGCVLDVTGGPGFQTDPAAQTTVNFVDPADVATPATVTTIISDTQLWVTVPAGLSVGTEYTIRVDNLTGGTGTASTTGFLVTSGAGGCAPTITSFTPTCGSAGDVFKITGTNLLASDHGGGLVEFSPFAAGPPVTGVEADPTNPDISDFTTLQVIVPTGVADGPIRVTTYTTHSSGSLFSTALFTTPPPDCPSGIGTEHARGITFKINKKGKASGVVSSAEDPAFTDCVAAVPVKIQRKKAGGGWKTVGKTTTDDTGAYTKKVKNKKGKQKFRALAPKVSLGDPVTDLCLKAKSATRKA
jgi:hypothetical protein